MPVEGAPLLPTIRLPPGVRTPWVHHGSLPPSKSAVSLPTPEVRTPQKEVHHDSLPLSKAVVALLGRPHQHSAALAPAQCYSQVQHSPAVYCGKRTSTPSQSYRRGGGLAAAAATALYCGHRCTSAPKQSYRRGGGLAAAAATALYCRRRCSVERTVSHDNYVYRCIAAETAGYAPRTSSPRARLVGIARTRFPKPGRRNVAPVAVAADKTNAAVVDDCAAELVIVAHNLPCWPSYFLKKEKRKKCYKITKLYETTLCSVLDGSFDRLSLHFVFLSLEKALSAYLSI